MIYRRRPGGGPFFSFFFFFYRGGDGRQGRLVGQRVPSSHSGEHFISLIILIILIMMITITIIAAATANSWIIHRLYCGLLL